MRSVQPTRLLLLFAGLLCSLPAAGQERSPVLAERDRGELQLQDRIVAVVDEDPILSSDLDRAITLGLAEQREGESERAFRRRVLDALIDQSVRLHEVSRFGIEQVPVEAIERQVEAIRTRFDDDEEFLERLEEVGLDVRALRQLVARQLSILVYFEEFLGPRIFVDLEEVRAYYEETFAPAMRAEGVTPPPIEDVREQIRELLKQQRLNDAIDRRTEELRREADVLDFFDDAHAELPPVVLVIGGNEG